MKNLKKILWMIVLPIALFALVTYIGNVLLIGEKLGAMLGDWAEILFDAALILSPIIILLFQIRKNFLGYRFFCIDKLQDSESAEELDNFLDTVKQNNIQNNILTAYDFDSAKNSGAKSKKKQFIRDYIAGCKAKSTKECQQIALMAALSVVVSPQSFGDTLCVLFWNFKTINKILNIYGIRPSGLGLIKLYAQILFASMLVGSIEEVMSNLTPPGINSIPFLSPISQAVSTIFAIEKTIYLTQYYLEHGIEDAKREEAKKEAMNFALKQMPAIINDEQFKSSCTKIFNCSYEYIKEKLQEMISSFFSSFANKKNEV